MYKTEERIGASKTGEDGKLRVVSAIDSMQDCSQFWLESEPVFESYLTEQGCALFIAFRQVEVLTRPAYGEQITTCTGIYKCKTHSGYRNTVIYNSKGEPCILSWCIGAFVDLKTGRLTRLPEHILESITIDEKVEMTYLPKKIPLPGAPLPEHLPEMHFRQADIDINRHVNNARYLEAGMEMLPEDFEVGGLRVEYKRAANRRDTLYPQRIKVSPDQYVILLCDAGGQPYTIMEFTRSL